MKYKIKFNNLKSILGNDEYTSLINAENNNQTYTKIYVQTAGGNFTFGLKQQWFDYIKNQIKTIEGRLNKGIFAKLKVGDTIIFKSKKMKIITTITYIKKYSNFKTMLKSETLEKVLPNVESINDGVDIYHQYYSPDDEAKYGVLAFGLELKQNMELKQIQTHESKLQSPYYEYIRDGEKIYEARVNDHKRQKMNIGDVWIFKHNLDQTLPPIRTKIIEKKLYDSFAEAITDIGVEQLLPQIQTLSEAIHIYENFDNGNYKLDAIKYGVVVFKIKVKTE